MRELLALLGSSAPAPGGGAAAALVGALGAGLVEMTANLTVGRERYAAVEAEAQAIVQQAREARERFQAWVEEDAAVYGRVSAAYRRPRGSEDEKRARQAAIQAALAEAAQVPLDVAAASAALLRLCRTAAPLLNPNVISDVMVGAQLAHAALESAAINVQVNTATMADRERAIGLDTALAEARSGAADALAEVLAVGRERMPGK